MKRILTSLGALLFLLFAAVLFVSLVYIPRQVIYAARYPITESPADVGVEFEDVTISPADAPLNLQGWWMPAADPIATLVFIHGGSSNRHTSFFKALDFYRAMIDRNVNVFAIDLRNHGASDEFEGGIRFGWTEKADATAAIEWADAKTPDLPVIAMGISMGGATLIYAMADGADPDGLILLDPLLNTETCVASAVYSETGIPKPLLAPSAWSAVNVFGLPGGDRQALEIGKSLVLPTLLIQDPGDPVTLARFAEALAAANPGIEFWKAPAIDPADPKLESKGLWGAHVGAFHIHPEPTLATIMTFIHALPRPQ